MEIPFTHAERRSTFQDGQNSTPDRWLNILLLFYNSIFRYYLLLCWWVCWVGQRSGLPSLFIVLSTRASTTAGLTPAPLLFYFFITVLQFDYCGIFTQQEKQYAYSYANQSCTHFPLVDTTYTHIHTRSRGPLFNTYTCICTTQESKHTHTHTHSWRAGPPLSLSLLQYTRT